METARFDLTLRGWVDGDGRIVNPTPPEPDVCVVCGSRAYMTWVEADRAWYCDDCGYAHV